MSEWWRVLMQHCNTATRQRDTSVMKKGIIPCLLGLSKHVLTLNPC